MALTVDHAREAISLGAGDPFMEKLNRDHILGFLNQAAADTRNSGWLIALEEAESIGLLANIYEYDVPLRFAYVKMLRLGDKNRDNASTSDTGTLLDDADFTSTELTFTVDDGTIWDVNDPIQIGSEIMVISAIATNLLTVTSRGAFGTTAATHANDAPLLRPFADITYEQIIPRAYWRMKVQSGGPNNAAAAQGSRPQFVFNSNFFSFTANTPIKVIGQRRPTVTYASGDTLDTDMESFLVERAIAYSARFLYAQGDHPHMLTVYRDALSTSTQFMRSHPQEFRVKPNSTIVPGGR